MAGSRSGDYDDYFLLGYDAMKFGNIPTFRRNLSHTSSQMKSKSSKKALRSRRLGVFLLVLVFDHEDGSGMLFRNFTLIPNYRVLQPRRRYYWRYCSLLYIVACRAVIMQ
jgi:hypothetical protein